MTELELVDPSGNPHLQGRFAPVHEEIDASDLTVEGDLPADLVGAYLRNGPNPMFPPLGSYTYPMEGDGMLHGLWFDGGAVRYRNRWVQTEALKAEERAGKALFGGVMTPAFVDMDLLGPDPDPGWPSKLDAFINIVRHNGRYLALEEGTPAYEVSPELETIGRFDFDGGLPKGMCAHPKIDPATGELVSFRYDVEAPFLSWGAIAAAGTVAVPETPVDIDEGVMVHDFVVTEQYLVLVLSPAVFDIEAMLAGGPLLAWKPDMGTRIAVIHRDGTGPVRWIHHDAFWVWHFANGHDQPDGTIAMDFPRWRTPGFLTPGVPNSCDYVQAVLNPDAGTISMEVLHTAIGDFPRIDDRLTGQPQRYSVLTTVSDGRPSSLVAGEHDALARIDLGTGAWAEFPTGGALGETLFVPRPGGTDELDGWYLGYVNSDPAGSTTLGIWEAADFPSAPRATVHLPQRVPNGLHGNWFPAT
jgi:carotenoid cleavage dioxygenase